MIRLALDAPGGQKVVLITSDAEAITVQTGKASAKKMKSQVTQKSNLTVSEEDFIHDVQQQYIAQGYVMEADDSDLAQKLFISATFDQPVAEELITAAELAFGKPKRTNGSSGRVHWQLGTVVVTLSRRPDGLSTMSASTTPRRGQLATAFIMSLNPDASATDGTHQSLNLEVCLRQGIGRSPLSDEIMEFLYTREVLRRPFSVKGLSATSTTTGLHHSM